ncbi:MAG: hypothetical protein WBM23_10055 [Desulfomonilia bacterium]
MVRLFLVIYFRLTPTETVSSRKGCAYPAPEVVDHMGAQLGILPVPHLHIRPRRPDEAEGEARHGVVGKEVQPQVCPLTDVVSQIRRGLGLAVEIHVVRIVQHVIGLFPDLQFQGKQRRPDLLDSCKSGRIVEQGVGVVGYSHEGPAHAHWPQALVDVGVFLGRSRAGKKHYQHDKK